jgi:tetratricopeptide (TPR) repeat protein
MTFPVGLTRCAMVLLAGCALTGCLRSPPSPMDEEKESHFLLGRSRASAMDYPGAIDSFNRALEVNPKSGAAHFELACLYEKRETDPAAAIYHYQQYLKLRPKADNTETVNQHIQALKQELARTVSLGVVSERQQREFERVCDDNRRLNEELEKWRAYALRLQELTNQNPAAASGARAAKPPTSSPPAQASPATAGAPSASSNSKNAVSIGSQRTHTVRAGETAAMIARQHGVRVEALLAANPRIEPKRLRVGQTLTIPAGSL